MKNISLCLAIIILSLCSCSSDDDTPRNDDVIIGEWQLREIQQNGGEIPLQACQDQETYIFNEDFSFRVEVYEPVEGEEDCVISNFADGAWGTSSDGQYFTNTTGTNFPFEARFSADQNEMTISILDQSVGLEEQRIYDRQIETEE